MPPANLGAYLRDFEALMEQHRVHGVPYGHFGDGCVHIRIDFPLDEPGGHAVYRDFITDAARLTASHGGSLSGEHGDGRARSELLPLMYSAETIALFRAVKDVFDPTNLLNPGVLVEPAPLDADLRGSGRGWAPGLAPERQGLRLLHDDGDFGKAVHRCTGVGKCLADASASGAVMCPSFQATRDEKDSTRGRARVLQEMVDGRLVTGGYAAPEVHEALDLCLSCKGCLNDCPTGIDMATYKSEVLHQTYRGRRRPRSHYVLGRLPFWARLLAPIAWFANLGLRTPGLRSIARWIAGVDQRRSLPMFATKRFSRLARRTTRPGGTVLLWADSFTEYFSTAGGLAAIDVLEAAGYQVETLERPQCCGLTWITTGQLDTARELVGRAVEQLHPYVAAGVPVVGLEPSCLSVLRSDAVELLDDPRAVDVAEGVMTLAELLDQHRRLERPRSDRHRGRRPAALPPGVGDGIRRRPGRARALRRHRHPARGVLWSGRQLRRREGSLRRLRGHRGAPAAARRPRRRPDAVVLADGFSCRTQLDDLAGVQALHLAQLLVRTSASGADSSHSGV